MADSFVKRQNQLKLLVMKLKFILPFVVAIIISCKENKTTHTVNDIDYKSEELDPTTSIYPASITKVLDAHGGLDRWNKMHTLKFSMQKDDGEEVTITDLKNRKSLIDMPNYTIGFNGTNVWLNNKEDIDYNGKPKFYYNLMFYFYAMPFVLADDGIIYEDVEPLKFEGKEYPGIKISYESGVGESPEDEYIMYYDNRTYKMTWLGYTVTYFTKAKSKEFHFIKYSEWQVIDGLKLPKTLTWYGYKNNRPTEKQRDVEFTKVELSTDKINAEVFQKPEEAEYVE